MLGTAQPDALGSQPSGTCGVLGCVGVGADFETPDGVGVVEEAEDGLRKWSGRRACLQGPSHLGGGERHRTQVHRSGGAVDGDGVALAHHCTRRRGELPGGGVDDQRVGAADADPAHAAGDDGGMAGLAAPAGQDRLCGDHAGQVLGGGFAADQDGVLSAGNTAHSGVRVDHHGADRRTGRGGHPRGQGARRRCGWRSWGT